MWYSKELKEFLSNSIKLTQCNAIYLTDLKNILYVGSKENMHVEEITESISKELLETLLRVNIKAGDEQVLTYNITQKPPK